MKLDAARIEGFLNAPGAASLVLLHGKDAGLVAERGRALVKTVLGGAEDPFRFAELDSPAPDALLAEASAASLTGGRRVVRVREAGEGLAKALETLLKIPPEALVVLEAGDLTPRSRLRTVMEKHPQAVAIACYGIDAARLPRAVAERLRDAGIAIAPEAADWVANNISPEEGPLRQAVELLALYAGEERRLSLEDVAAALPAGGETSAQDAVDAMLAGDIAGTDRALALAYEEGASPVGILRVLLGELMRLRVAAASGLPAAQAVAAMRPPVFFKRAPLVTKALGLWTEPALAMATRTALAAEAACKTTHVPDQAFCRQTMLDLASRARRKI